MRRDVQEIFRATPHDKQVMMFSATLSAAIRPVCRKFCQDVNIFVLFLALHNDHTEQKEYPKNKIDFRHQRIDKMIDMKKKKNGCTALGLSP